MLRRLALWVANKVMRGQTMTILDGEMPIFNGTINRVEERRDMREHLWLYAIAVSRQGDIRGVPAAFMTRCRVRKAWVYRQ
jgi:hypothetical protein